jgi:hypothetical protein
VDKGFDLRLAWDREELASYLPTFDGRTFRVSSEDFVSGLAHVSKYLGQPEWLTYRWGVLGPLPSGKSSLHLDLERIVILGHELQRLSVYDGFEQFLRGFANPAQFHDALFEAQVATIFATRRCTQCLTFAVKHDVRGHKRRPEFDLETTLGPMSIECKRRHPDTHASSRRLKAITGAIVAAMDSAKWPADLRLEVEIVKPLRKQTSTFATELVHIALQSPTDEELIIPDATAVAYVVPREAAFRITKIQAGNDRVILPPNKSTGLFNPAYTAVRVVMNDLDQRIATTVGAQVSDALAQLPENRLGIIILGAVPLRIAKRAIERRVTLPAYERVLAIGVMDNDDELHFGFREDRRGMVEQLMRA